MNKTTTAMSMVIAALMSAVTMYRYSLSFLVYSDTYHKFTTSHKVLFIASIPIGFVALSLVAMVVTVPVMWMIQWHVNYFIKDMRDLW